MSTFHLRHLEKHNVKCMRNARNSRDLAESRTKKAEPY